MPAERTGLEAERGLLCPFEEVFVGFGAVAHPSGVQESGMDFAIVGEVVDAETIAINLSIRENADLRARCGGRRWRKRKGKATVRMPSGQYAGLSFIGTKRTGSANERSRSSTF